MSEAKERPEKVCMGATDDGFEYASAAPARPKAQGGDYRPHYRKADVDAYIERLEYERDAWRAKCKMLMRATGGNQ